MSVTPIDLRGETLMIESVVEHNARQYSILLSDSNMITFRMDEPDCGIYFIHDNEPITSSLLAEFIGAELVFSHINCDTHHRELTLTLMTSVGWLTATLYAEHSSSPIDCNIFTIIGDSINDNIYTI